MQQRGRLRAIQSLNFPPEPHFLITCPSNMYKNDLEWFLRSSDGFCVRAPAGLHLHLEPCKPRVRISPMRALRACTAEPVRERHPWYPCGGLRRTMHHPFPGNAVHGAALCTDAPVRRQQRSTLSAQCALGFSLNVLIQVGRWTMIR